MGDRYAEYSNIFIGDQGASSNDLVNYITASKSFTILFNKFDSLVIKLEHDEKLDELRLEKRLDVKVLKLLKEWRSSQPEKATLQNFLLALLQVGCKDIANCVENKYREKIEQLKQDNTSNINQNTDEISSVTVTRNTINEGLNEEPLNDTAAVKIPDGNSQFNKRQNLSDTDSKDQCPLIGSNSNTTDTTQKNDISKITTPHASKCSVNGSFKKDHSHRQEGKIPPRKKILTFLCILYVSAFSLFGVVAYLLRPKYMTHHGQKNLTAAINTHSGMTTSTHLNISMDQLTTVKSYGELTQALRTKSMTAGFSLVIQGDTDSIWPSNETIANMNLITNLTLQGNIGVNFVSTILENATALEEIHFDGWFDLQCSLLNNNMNLHLQLPSIKILTISNFTSCHATYFKLIRSHNMINIKDLRINGGVIDNGFIKVLQDILKQLSNLLRLEISTSISTLNPIFFDIGSSSVEEMGLNLSYLHETSMPYSLQKTENYFCKVFSRLNTLHTKKVDIPLKLLLQCKNLQVINTTLFLSGNDTMPDLSLLKKEINSITNISLHIKFTHSCPSRYLTCIKELGIQYLAQYVNYLRIKSNCETTKDVFTYSTSANENSFPC